MADERRTGGRRTDDGLVTAADVLAAADAGAAAHAPAAGRSWDVPVPDLDFTAETVMAHAEECCLWYAALLAGEDFTIDAVQQRIRPGAGGDVLVRTLPTVAFVLAAVVDAADDERRGTHPFGVADRSGMAAMGCDELLVHTDDAARALGAAFAPDPDLADRVRRRLFPWAEVRAGDGSDDPWTLLRWCNGRLDLADRPHQERWLWHCAPLAEWDGSNPNARPR